MGGSRCHVPISTCQTVLIHVTHSTSQLLQTAFYRVKMGDGTSGTHVSSLVYLVSFLYTVFEVSFILPVTIRERYSILQTIEDINFGLVRMYVTLYRIVWIIFTSN